MKRAFLAEFELYVMLAIARLGDGAYGAEIRREIESRTGRSVAVGALYTTLARLAEKGYLRQQVREPEPGERGRPRKLCTLTAGGERALQTTTNALRNMMDGLEPARGGA
ncbi:MAG: helix-turn-helix transcriptional regulator [Acidobacteriota bacterium]